ncbi:MAG TPA: hypothetical protein DDW41_04315 [Candidatus Andersenbacteria bacterium]|nr:hypothetical protein [Candidatus Andersenbacteria bacterium]
MVTYRYITIDLPEAELLADLEGIRQDLMGAIENCDLIIKNMKTGSSDFKFLEAVSSSAVVRYARSFNTGVRATIPKYLLDDMSDEQRRDHSYFINLRDKHIAHSVNVYEENEVVAYLTPEERGQRGVQSISVQHKRVLSIGDGSAMCLKALCSYLLQRIENLIITEKEKLMAVLNAIPVDELYAMKARSPRPSSEQDVSRPRRKVQRNK